METIMRKDVPVEETWDLSLIYGTEEEFDRDMERLTALCGEIEKEFKGKLNSAENIVKCLDMYEQAQIIMYNTGSYVSLAASVDRYDTYIMEREKKTYSVMTDLESRLSFIESDIAAADPSVLEEALSIAKGCKNYIKDILEYKPHRLSPETEQALASLSETFNTPYDVYTMAKMADMRFDPVEAGGKQYPMGYSLFEDDYEYTEDTELRRNAFRNFYGKLRQYENTNAACYNAYVTTDRTMAKARGFDSVFDYLLFEQKVTREMYDRQIDLITEELAPAMRKYARIIQKMHGLDEMTFADLKLPVDAGFDPKVTISESKDYVKNALSILGDDYAEMVEEAYRDRWIDFAKNQGKDTGGFCDTLYGKNSYILLSWNDRMSDVFTIAHELGHAGHFMLCNDAQSMYDTRVSSYMIEAPSTMNELVLGEYLIKQNDDKRFRRWVLSSLIGNTYYHNFVTHLREAWYQREVYRIIDEGGSVNAERLNEIFRKGLEVFWGDDVVIPEGAELTWMRQPHYYMGLYSYTYSAGLTVATEAILRIREEGDLFIKKWRDMLTAGSTLDPVGLAALAGIDITTDAPLKHTIGYISGMIDEIAELTYELDGIRI